MHRCAHYLQQGQTISFHTFEPEDYYLLSHDQKMESRLLLILSKGILEKRES